MALEIQRVERDGETTSHDTLHFPNIFFRNQASTWQSRFEELTELVAPFKTQLEQYGVERDTLMEQKNTTQKEFDRLADDFAK